MPTPDQVNALQTLKRYRSSQGDVMVQELAAPPDDLLRLVRCRSEEEVIDRVNQVSVRTNVPRELAEWSACRTKEELRQRLEQISNPAQIPKDLSNWGSNEPASGRTWRIFKDLNVNEYIVNLFFTVQGQVGEGAGTWRPLNVALDPADLFHCHWILDTSTNEPDVLLLFHMKEYPRDLEPHKSQQARSKFESPVFTSTEPGFERRNSIFSLRHQRLWNLRYQNVNDFMPLLGDVWQLSSSARSELAAIVELPGNVRNITVTGDALGEEVGAINYFPAQLDHPFFSC